MNRLPDAPWIRDAEQNGVNEAPEVFCPCCGKVCEAICVDINGVACGCNNCIRTKDAWEWLVDEMGARRNDES